MCDSSYLHPETGMFRKLPDYTSKRISWLLVLAWVGVIFLTIPFARAIQRQIEKLLGSGAYLAAAGIAGLFFVLIVLAYIFRRRKSRIAVRIAWLAALVASSACLMKFQLQTPAEAIHFFEYGILSLLLFLAWSHHVRDWLVYPTAALSLTIIASTDEFIQWIMPGRYWDFRDIRLNLLAGLVIQAFIALVIQPSGIQRIVLRKSVRILCAIALMTIVILGLAFSNTPSRVDLYATRIPFLQFLANNESVMSEYGYRHRDPEIGTFYSRFTTKDLVRIDRERGRDAGELLARYQSFLDYQEFISMFTSSVDPFLHEMRVHLFRRDHYYYGAWQFREKDPARFTYHLTVAYRENQILEKYFSSTLIASGNVFNPEQYRQVDEFADLADSYTSPVSDHLVTVATEFEFRAVLMILAVITLLIYARYGRGGGEAIGS